MTDSSTNGPHHTAYTCAVYTAGEEIAHAVTHGVGAVMSVAALVLLVHRAAQSGDPWRIASFSIFGATMVLLYTASTLYHLFARSRFSPALKVLDHSMIYLLISGTYTPFLLVSLRGSFGGWLFSLVWGLALAGVAFKIGYADRFPLTSTLLYLGLGWICVVAAKPFLANVPPAALLWLLAGGLAYSLGTIFYLSKSMKYHHATWHLFVLAGTACHFQAVYGYL